jgi:hypothetical protein
MPGPRAIRLSSHVPSIPPAVKTHERYAPNDGVVRQ